MATGNSTPLTVFTQATINNNNNFSTTCCDIINCRIATLENWLLLMLRIRKLQNYRLEMYNKRRNFYHDCVTRIVLSAGRISVNVSTVSSRILTWRKWLQACKAYGTQRVYSPANREKKEDSSINSSFLSRMHAQNLPRSIGFAWDAISRFSRCTIQQLRISNDAVHASVRLNRKRRTITVT